LGSAEANHARTAKALKDVERALEATTAAPEKLAQLELAKVKAQQRLDAAATQLQLAKEQADAKEDAAARVGEAARAAEDARDAAVEAARAAARKLQPVSVFISRKAQRLYIRQANEPIYEGPVAIRNADKPIGTFVFTAVGDAQDGSNVQWNVVSMYKYSESAGPFSQPQRRRGEARNASPTSADVVAAKAALDRNAMPRDVIAEVSDVVLPGSSVIVSDEAASIETGKDTDFVVIMSGEPQGALKVRQREPLVRSPYDAYFGRGKSRGGWPFFWN
jgi:hypothetical protein